MDRVEGMWGGVQEVLVQIGRVGLIPGSVWLRTGSAGWSTERIRWSTGRDSWVVYRTWYVGLSTGIRYYMLLLDMFRYLIFAYVYIYYEEYLANFVK